MNSIFLSYAKEDKVPVESIFLALKEAGLDPWMDKPPAPFDLDGILPGQFWDTVLREKMKGAQRALAFLSPTSVAKKGYVQREFRLLLSYQAERPATTQFLIPVLLAPCDPPNHRVDTTSLADLQWFSLYESSLDSLIRFLHRSIDSDSDQERGTVRSSDPETISLHTQIYFLKRQMEQREKYLVEQLEKRIDEAEAQRDDWKNVAIDESSRHGHLGKMGESY
ncbi:MAG: toll/interleukin-1 receptor domain-containing protein [Pirellulales bacterium]